MSKYILYGYPFSHWTKVAQAKLSDAGVSFDLETNVGRVHPDGTHPLGLTVVPTLRRHDSCDVPMAEGLEAIEAWVDRLGKGA